MSDHKNLNPQQLEAVMHMVGPLLVFAGAGSGKTRVLTYRVLHLMEQGVDPFNIIAITFTNKAAKEMRERISTLSRDGDQVWVSTFHAACMRILRREIVALDYDNNFSIYDSQDSDRLIKECIKELNLDDKQYPPRSISATISAQKNELISAAEYEQKTAGHYRESKIADVYCLYQKKLKARNALDFDDIIFQTVVLLTNNENIRKKYQTRFQHILVDEYQDTNNAQYKLINLLVNENMNICVVGDDDQSIYGWRGANIENILRFEKDYPSAKVVKLEENYRSSQTILDAANAVIARNTTRATKTLHTNNDMGSSIKLFPAGTDREEATFVTRTILELTKADANYSNFAVLYRTNAQSRAIEDQLIMEGIPYRLYGGVRFYERMEIKDILAYLRVIYNPQDDIAILRIINVPRRGIGNVTITKLQQYAAQNDMPIMQVLANSNRIADLKNKKLKDFYDFLQECIEFSAVNSVSKLMDKILDETGYYESLKDGTPDGEARLENIDELKAKAYQYEREAYEATLGNFLEEVALVADIDNYNESADAISLMTIHSAKGLEFNNVFVVGLEENIFPSTQAVQSESPAAVEEERRLCYVAFTRARQRLYVSHARRRLRYDGYVSNPISRFLKEVPDICIERATINGNVHVGLASVREPFGAGISMHRPFRQSLIVPAKASHPVYKTGDRVFQARNGVGTVIMIEKKGADFEITIHFDGKNKPSKFLSTLSNIVPYNPNKHRPYVYDELLSLKIEED